MDDEAGSLGSRPEHARQHRARRGHRSRFRPGHRDSGPDRGGATYAALDLGTNNCRLLVARPTRDGFRVIDAF
jgi:exopolyphosphatase/guanosine-5'-triphosphate,3'-diphosphate pyrophosphatase